MRLCALALCLAAASGAWAQSYPVRPIRGVVAFPPGGFTDLLARQLALKLSESFGQQMIIDNRAGGGGVIAAVMVKDAPADGYTVFFATISTLATNPATNPKLPYDPSRDYAPVMLTASNPYFLVVHPSVPARTTAELIALAKVRPGQLNFGSSGTGGGAHLALEYFRSMAKIDMVHIPYKGAGPAMTDLLAGQVQMTMSQPPLVMSHARVGKLRVLGVTSLKRLASWPDAPPIAETLAGYESSSWQGVVVPVKTPKPIIARLHAEILKALHSKDIESRLIAEGTEIGGTSPEEFGRYIRSEIAKWTKVVKDANIKVE